MAKLKASICNFCGREIAEVRPYGSLYSTDRVWVHIDTNLAGCMHPGSSPFATPVSV